MRRWNLYTLRTTADNDFFEQFLNPFFGINQCFPGKITVAGENIVTAEKKDILYLPDLKSIPEDVPVKNIVHLFDVDDCQFTPIINKKFGELKLPEKLDLLLTGARSRRAGITIIKDSQDIRDLYYYDYIKKINDLRENGVVIYLGSIEKTYIPGALVKDILVDTSTDRYLVSEICLSGV
ncbi:MAG: hypothetical protein MUF15_21385 [Acidobacteria bacterium]|jgi:hypothetical protein|nr:hypothetical protein [Acidobacteriota bacterium]